MAKPEGLFYYPNIIPSSVLAELEDYFESSEAPWENITESTKSRQVIHYISAYGYSKGKTPVIHDLPPILNPLINLLKLTKLDFAPSAKSIGSGHGQNLNLKFEPDQVIVNKYDSGEGISAHTDDKKLFTDIIVCFTIYSEANLIFRKEDQEYTLYTEPGSLYVMTGESRYLWTHEMRKVKNDVVDGVKIPRGKRVSITLRKWKK